MQLCKIKWSFVYQDCCGVVAIYGIFSIYYRVSALCDVHSGKYIRAINYKKIIINLWSWLLLCLKNKRHIVHRDYAYVEWIDTKTIAIWNNLLFIDFVKISFIRCTRVAFTFHAFCISQDLESRAVADSRSTKSMM